MNSYQAFDEKVAVSNQFPNAISCLTRAFQDDPVLAYLFEDEEQRPLLLSAFFANRSIASCTLTVLGAGMLRYLLVAKYTA